MSFGGGTLLEYVSAPVWLLTILGLLAVVAIVDRAISPAIRSITTARRERAVERLNERLAVPIAPIKLVGRKALISQVILDPAVQSAIAAEVLQSGKSARFVEAQAQHYAREIVPAFSTALYFKVGTKIARKLSTALYRVRVGASDITALQGIPPNASVVFVINHRSNMDYILVTYLASRSSALSYAVGEWARVPGLAGLIRLMGAYFIRRGSGNQLYRRVLARYVHIATASGVTQAVFPEGGLSRDGRLQPARLGLIAYMVADFDPSGARDIVFVPVGLNYDRVLEDRVLVTAAAQVELGQKPRFGFRLTTFLGFVSRMIAGRVLGRWYKNGYACVSFGKPVSLKAYMTNKRIDFRTLNDVRRTAAVTELGATLIGEIGSAVPALPVSLVAAVFIAAHGQPISALELKASVARLIATLQASGAQVYVPRADDDYAVDVGLRMLMLRRLVVETVGLYAVVKGEERLLAYYANAIAHLLPTIEHSDNSNQFNQP